MTSRSESVTVSSPKTPLKYSRKPSDVLVPRYALPFTINSLHTSCWSPLCFFNSFQNCLKSTSAVFVSSSSDAFSFSNRFCLCNLLKSALARLYITYDVCSLPRGRFCSSQTRRSCLARACANFISGHQYGLACLLNLARGIHISAVFNALTMPVFNSSGSRVTLSLLSRQLTSRCSTA